jgi:hypothetical protein
MPPSTHGRIAAGATTQRSSAADEFKAGDAVVKEMQQGQQAAATKKAEEVDPETLEAQEAETLKQHQQLKTEELHVLNRVAAAQVRTMELRDLSKAHADMEEAEMDLRREQRLREVEAKLEPMTLEDLILKGSIEQEVPLTPAVLLRFRIPTTSIQRDAVQAMTVWVSKTGEEMRAYVGDKDGKMDGSKLIPQMNGIRMSAAITVATCLVGVQVAAKGMQSINAQSQWAWVTEKSQEVYSAVDSKSRITALLAYAEEMMSRVPEVVFSEFQMHAQAFNLRARKTLDPKGPELGVMGKG